VRDLHSGIDEDNLEQVLTAFRWARDADALASIQSESVAVLSPSQLLEFFANSASKKTAGGIRCRPRMI
jgi:hypothetical protein